MASALEIGDLDPSAALACLALLYWAEGSKDKPYERRERVVFANSDPDLIAVFVHLLRLLNVPASTMRYRIHLHETADARVLHRRWAAVLGIDEDAFSPPTVKRHKPLTNRRNVDDAYNGVMVVSVVESADLYRRIHGWFQGAVASLLQLDALDGMATEAWKD